MSKYDDVNFKLLRFSSPVGDAGAQGSISCPSLGTAYVGSTLKVAKKAAVLGVTFQIQSGGSAAGTNSVEVARVGTGGTSSVWKAQTIVTSAGASMANDTIDISLASEMTLASLGEGAAILGNAASLDKVVIIKNIIWRYRLLPQQLPWGAIR
jgi:hypothetical protein